MGREEGKRSIVIHELTRDDGTLSAVRLVREEDGLFLDAGDEALPLPERALEAVMNRFGKPLGVPLPKAQEELDLGEGRRLVRFRFLSRFDVIARDYLALLTPDEEPRCELATAVTAALDHLAKAANRG